MKRLFKIDCYPLGLITPDDGWCILKINLYLENCGSASNFNIKRAFFKIKGNLGKH